jgi:hypothetical protein
MQNHLYFTHLSTEIYHFRVSSAGSPMNPLASNGSEQLFRAKVVGLIIDGRAELALKLLSKYYAVSEPALKVGTVKRHRRVLACYLEKERRIYLSKSEYVTSPFVILHEFYHHLRASQVMRRGQVEKRADLFATNFIRDFVSQHQLTCGGNC